MSFQDPYITGSDFDTRAKFSSPRSAYPTSVAASSVGHNIYQRPGAYHRFDSQRGAYLDNTPSPVPYQSPNLDAWLPPYQNVYMQHDSYQSVRGHGSYQY